MANRVARWRQRAQPAARAAAALVSVVSVSLVLSAEARAQKAEPPRAVSTARQGQVAVDGRLDEAAWSRAPWNTGFTSASDAAGTAGAPSPAAVQTRFKVLHDGAALYLAVECDEPLLDQLRARYTGQDQETYADDSVEIFLDPAGEGRYYHQFIVNANGAWYDAHVADYGLAAAKLWDCPLQTAAAVDQAARCWRLEVRIPLAGLQLRGEAGSTWLLNVARERQATGELELTTWSPLKGNFHQPRLFGSLSGVDVDYGAFAVTTGEPQVVAGEAAGARRQVRLRVPVTNAGEATRHLVLSAGPFPAPGTTVTAAAVEIPAGATRVISPPALEVPAGDAEARFLLAATEAETGATAHMAVKRLSVAYVPIAVQILEPVYRDNIYATQDVGEIAFSVGLAEAVAARAARVTYALESEEGVLALPGASGQTRPAALPGEVRLPVGGLPVGSYRLAVWALAANGDTVATASRALRKLPPAPGVEVRVDGTGNILVDGRPHLFVGWYGNVPLQDPRPDVVALQNLITPRVLAGLEAEDLRDLRELHERHGIHCLVSIEPGRLYSTFRLWQRPDGEALRDEITTRAEPSQAMREMLAALVGAVQAEPAVVGYYLADEPEINDARAEYMEAVYRLMRELDPYRPVMITNDTMDGIVTHGYRACDILSPDPYSPAWEYVPAFLRRCREVAGPGQALAMTPWTASAQTHFDRDMGSAPPYPYEVMRHQWLTALALGARAFTGYTDAFFMAEPRLRYGLPPIWRELRFLEAAVAHTQPAPEVEADADMAAWLGRTSEHLYLIVSNYRPGERRAHLRHPLLEGIAALDVVGEGRSVRLQDGGFGETFGEGAVRIYTTDPAGRDLPLVTEVAAEVARREAACVVPGNLLHWSRGVRARRGPGGFAPWFTQYHYYAINGIRDDDGWWLSHTDEPSSLELALPQPERVGRVVLYVDNMRDYDLRLRASDGAQYLAEVRGNAAVEVVHRFAAPVTVIQLEVRALASQEGPGSRGAMVREVEAYGEPGKGPVTALRRLDP